MKKVLSLLLMCIMLWQLCPAALADEAIPARATTQFNLRKEAYTGADRVANVPQGATLTILSYEEDGAWCRVKYRNAEGYAKKEWLRAKNSKENSSGASVGQSESGEPLWLCSTLTKFTIRQAPNDDARRMRQVQRGEDLYCLAWGDDWCLVQTRDKRVTGYAKTRWLFHFQSYDSFENGVPGYEAIRPTGYVVMKANLHITDDLNTYGGNDLKQGDVVFVQQQTDGRLMAQIYRHWDEIPADMCDYYPLTDWRKAKAGDIIGGYTQYFGQTQGHRYAANRKVNIGLALAYINDTVLAPGEEFSYLTTIGPVTKSKGYLMGILVGSTATGIGGGVCHGSTLTYEAALSLPFLITEREPHTDDGANYAPLEFDATVGSYSDLRFINTLPYPVKIHTFMNAASGVMTMQFECMETLDAETLAAWNNCSWDRQ